MLICSAFTNFIAPPILTVAHKWGLILTKMFAWTASNHSNFNNNAYLLYFVLLMDLEPS